MVEGNVRPWFPAQGRRSAWQREYHRVLGVAALVIFFVDLLIAIASLLGDQWAHLRPGIWVASACYLGCLVIAFSVMRWGICIGTAISGLPVALAALVSGSSVTWYSVPAVAELTDRLVPVNGLQAVQAMCLLSLTRLRLALAAIAASVPLYLWLTSMSADNVLHLRVDQVIITTGTSFSIALAVSHLRRNAAKSEALQASLGQAASHQTVEAHAERELDEVRRLIHDRIIGTLRIIESSRDATQAIRASLSAQASLRTFEPITSVARLRLELSGKGVPHVVVSGDWSVDPPSRVVTAFREAAGEAARNAFHHGGVDQLAAHLSDADGGQVILTLRDEGMGFDVENVPRGFGVAESIHRRMEEVGGEALIASAPGEGTTVTLKWPHLEPGQGGRESGLLPAAGRSRLYMLMALPAAVIVPHLAYAHSYGHRLLSLLLAGAVLATIFTVSWLVGRQRPSWTEIVGVAATNAGFTVASVAVARPDMLLNPDAWIVPATAIVIAMVALESSLLQAIFLGVAQAATVIGLSSLAPDVGPLGAAAAIVLSAAAATLGFIGGFVLRRGARNLAVESALATARAQEQGWVRSALAARSRYLSRLRADIEPFLRGIADGTIPLDDAARRQAAAFARSSRDDLNQLRPIGGELRRRLHAARSRGVLVNLRSGSLDPAAVTLLEKVLAYVLSAEAVTLLPAGEGRTARVSVVPQATPTEVAQLTASLDGMEIITTENPPVSTTFALASPELVTSSEGSGDFGSSS